LLDRGVLDPVPNFRSEVALVHVRQELDALERVELGPLGLVALQSEQNHAQDGSQVAVLLHYQLGLLVKPVRNRVEEG